MSLSSGVNDLAARAAAEFRAVRSESATALAGKASTTHHASHATGGSDALTPADIGAATASHSHQTPLVPNPPVTVAYGTTITPDASLGNYFMSTLTGNPTLQPPSNGTEGQRVWFRGIASGAARTITFGAGYKRSTGVGTSVSPASGKRVDIGMIYEAADGWTITIATPQQ